MTQDLESTLTDASVPVGLTVDRRLLEQTFPVADVSRESVREKNIRRGHISTLHIWWARLPLASSRATNFAALVPAPTNITEIRSKRQFLAKLSKWESSLDRSILHAANSEILDANGGRPPKILDPFSGGGSIPLESLRLGCETYANDYNPVAALILKSTLEYPQKFAGFMIKDGPGLATDAPKSKLLGDVDRWGKWIYAEASRELEKFYSPNSGGLPIIGYIWARTIPCQNPSCQATIPLLRQYWLSNRPEQKISLYPNVRGHQLTFTIVGKGYDKIPTGFDPEKGTVSRAIATCLVCNSVIDGDTTRSLFLNGKGSHLMLAVVSRNTKAVGLKYRRSNHHDETTYASIHDYLALKRGALKSSWGLDPLPDEPTPEGKGSGAERAFSVRNYGLMTWADLFNERQKLALLIFEEKIRLAGEMMLKEGLDEDYRKVISLYLAFVLDRVADYNSTLCRWQSTWERNTNTFARSALPIVWDYWELNALSESSGGWLSMLRQIERAIESLMFTSHSAVVTQSSATKLPYQDNFFDAVFTDPPYYDNIPYSYLSDFFYVWLRRTIGHLYPEFFATPLTPKSQEIVAYGNRLGGLEAGKVFFEDMLGKAFNEINRTLRPGGIATVVYAHKSTAGWETLLNSLWDSGLVVTAAWPVHTEMKTRLRAIGSAALASSIYIVARKFPRSEIGFYRELRAPLRKQLEQKLDQLWDEGISGADFFVSAIGSSIQVFSRFDRILDEEGNMIRANRLLDDVRTIVTEYTVRRVLKGGISGQLTPMSRFYLLWRWAFGEDRLPFDEAKKLAQGVGIDVALQWNKGFIRKDKDTIWLLEPSERVLDELEHSRETIDILHRLVLLWSRGRNDEMLVALKASGLEKNETMYGVAQAIAESLPIGNKEKKLLEGFLQTRTRMLREGRTSIDQTKLFE